MRRAVVGGALVLLIAVPSPAIAGPAGQAAPEPAENPFDGARSAERHLSFAGTVDVRWVDARGPHAEHLDVRAAGGAIALQGGSTLLADPGGATMVRSPEGKWDLLWTGTPTSAGRPELDEKYDVAPVAAAPTMVASRPTRVVEVRQADVVRERLYLDVDNGLLLRREQLDLNGQAVHSVAFSSIDVGAQISPPPTPSRPSDESPDHTEVSAPDSLPGGYRQVDAYREKGAVQVLYSDGLYDMSVFEQQGALARRDVPAAGRPVKVGSANGWAYAWAGGQVLLWHRGHTVYSLVSEAPVDQMVAAAKALPAAGGSSLLTRLRRVCRALVQPLAR